jgi:hypothetical protein
VDPNRNFDCGFLNGDPSTISLADEDGYFTTPSDVGFPVGETAAEYYASYIQNGRVPGSEPPSQPAS